MRYLKKSFLMNAASFFVISVTYAADHLTCNDTAPSSSYATRNQFVESINSLSSVEANQMQALLRQVRRQPELFPVFLELIPQKVYPQYDKETALAMINFAARDGRLGFTNDSRTATSGFEFLRKQVGLGSDDAQKELNEAAVNGCLIFNTPAKRREYLEKIAARKNAQGHSGIGAHHAQSELNNGALRGKLGFTHETGQEYLESVIKRGTIGVEHAKALLTAFRKSLGSH